MERNIIPVRQEMPIVVGTKHIKNSKKNSRKCGNSKLKSGKKYYSGEAMYCWSTKYKK